jgi:hypothetical protein
LEIAAKARERVYIDTIKAHFGHRYMGTHKNRTVTRVQRISNPMSPRLLPLKKAAEHLGLTTWAMRERIWAGDIPVVRFPGGRKIYLDAQDLEKFIQKNKTTI